MHRSFTPALKVGALLAPVVLFAALASAPAAAETFLLNMTGAQEVPGPGDADGTATGTLVIDDASNQISWSFTYANIAAPTLMHIHTGAAGVSGGVLVNLGVATSGGPGTLIGMTTATNTQVNTILANPAGFYVNIHNSPFPAGAVRGQLGPAPATVFPVTLLGENEFPGPGDPDGSASGTLTVNPGNNTISWDFVYSDIAAPTLFHIHSGPAGVAGPVLVDLGVATLGGPGTLINSVSGVSNANINLILGAPENHYLNLHNADFPAGAVRQQLVVAPPPPCPTDLNGDGVTDGADLGVVLAAWDTADRAADFNGDGVVDGADLGILLAAWGPCPT